MIETTQKLRVAMPAWEIGRVGSGLGAKVGGLGVIIEELPPELVKAAGKQNIALEVEILSPCFAHYDRTVMIELPHILPVTLHGNTFNVTAYEYVFPDGQKAIYFWDEWQLGWTSNKAIYPNDPTFALHLFAVINQAMAEYIRQEQFDTVHLHDYHVGLIPFYLGDDLPATHLTIHNATYQGMTPCPDSGYAVLDRIGLDGGALFHRYFDFFNQINLMKACMLKVHETGGKVTTVSGDIEGSWGYAAELKASHAQLYQQAVSQKGTLPGEVFVPNRHLDLFEKLPIAGITNGMSDQNRAENLPQLKASVLQAIQARQAGPIFTHPTTQKAMLSADHNFTPDTLQIKAELRRLLHLEAFGIEPHGQPILITAIGRLVAQKNLGLVADVVERVLYYDEQTKFIILASAPDGDGAGKASEAAFFDLAHRYPGRVYFNNGFNLPMSKLILAGGDFALIPSRFEPCGLVDYEASLVGNVVIGRATGGLTKVRHCAYLYEWLDISDRGGEANAFFEQIQQAIYTYRHNQAHHATMMRTAMTLDSSWDSSAAQYIEMYRYGLHARRWYQARRALQTEFTASLGDDLTMFDQFFIPAQAEYSDLFDWGLKNGLN